MYIGSTDARGRDHCIKEIVDNSIDEALAGHCTHITLRLTMMEVVSSKIMVEVFPVISIRKQAFLRSKQS
jgi:DNA gyrase/topoisomerase IV subunit B